MVRINLIGPEKLADQHLIAEYNEMLMLLGYVKKYPEATGIPESYTLGKGHIKFFKDKLKYIKKRHELIKKEMRKRRFRTDKAIDLKKYPKGLRNDWTPKKRDIAIIISRLVWKINRKPEYYRYYGEHKPKEFFIALLR